MLSATQKYTKGDVKRAGDFLRNNEKYQDSEDYHKAHETLSYWRSMHVTPMQLIIKSIRNKAISIDPTAVVVQRLKRTPSIIAKLKREKGMRLDRMEDIIGCRVIVTNNKQVLELYKLLKQWKTKHILQRERDYLTYVKESGYRGIHLVYKYNGNKSDFQGKPIELQIRSRVQHSWATAVEIAGIFTKQTLKASTGNPEWLRFFNLVSIAFADMENNRLLNNSDTDDREKLREITKKLQVIDKFKTFTLSTKYFGKKSKYPADYYILLLNIDTISIEFIRFNKNELGKANERYLAYEKKYKDDTKYDVVLVAASSIEGLKKAYPNYFAETDIFTTNLQLVLQRK